MKAKHLCIYLTSLLLLAVVPTPLFASWNVTVLTPSGCVRSGADGVSGGQQVGSVHGPTSGNYYPYYHASLWSGTAASWVDLHPAGATSSYALATSGSQQVGYAYGSATNNYLHASLWSGSATSWVDLHPAGTQYTTSWGYGASGGQQVGQISVGALYGPQSYHAALWSGTAGSFVDLSPYAGSACALDAWGAQQVGYTDGHAALWSGTAASKIDLNPAGSRSSRANGIENGQQAGCADVVVGSYMGEYGLAYEYETHAGMWSGTASSWVDLNPTGCYSSTGLSVSGGYQVGYAMGGVTGNETHASLWSGTASSWMDLHALLPSGYSYSRAKGVYVSGSSISVVGFARSLADNQDHAILWTMPVPEPSSLVALGSGLLGLCGVLRRRRA